MWSKKEFAPTVYSDTLPGSTVRFGLSDPLPGNVGHEDRRHDAPLVFKDDVCDAPAPLLQRSHVVERKDGKTVSRRALRARAGSRCGRRGRPVLQEPVLGAADGERRNRPGVLGFLLEVREAPMSAAAAIRLAHGEPESM